MKRYKKAQIDKLVELANWGLEMRAGNGLQRVREFVNRSKNLRVLDDRWGHVHLYGRDMDLIKKNFKGRNHMMRYQGLEYTIKQYFQIVLEIVIGNCVVKIAKILTSSTKVRP